ncbi:GPI-GlcNAc transferase complex, PIG-H component-domain-containing protein [Syncephalis fuscata]|nr:GPI-GlcNAc transferase complex, PIG-H component-domain-containing protein [Syncephalis fuscata]
MARSIDPTSTTTTTTIDHKLLDAHLDFSLPSSIPSIVLLAIFILWANSKRNTIREESLLVVRDFGLQVKTTYVGGRNVTRMIDIACVKDIVINEGITMFQVKFYLAILVDKQDKMVIIFEHLLPSLKILLKVYRGTRALMYSEEEDVDEEKEAKHDGTTYKGKERRDMTDDHLFEHNMDKEEYEEYEEEIKT